MTKNEKTNTKSTINRFCKFFSFNFIKLRSINVKNVIIPKTNEIIKIESINSFFFVKFNIMPY